MSKCHEYRIFSMLVAISVIIVSLSFFTFTKNKFFSKKSHFLAVHFDDSMQVKNHAAMLADSNTSALLALFKRLYEKNNIMCINRASTIKIPRYIHTIWLGSELPKQYEAFYQSWFVHHPEWTHIFWTDNPLNYKFGTIVISTFDDLKRYLTSSVSHAGEKIVVDTTKLAFDNRIFFDASKNYGERSDILRCEIVYRFGGLYIDMDFECKKSFDELHYYYDFYTGLQPLDTNYVQLGAALFAAIPQHPILGEYIQSIKQNQHIIPIVVKTGPICFTQALLKRITAGNYVNVVFPASYFYPCGYTQRELSIENWHKDEAFAVHHWAGSWIKPEGHVRT